MEEQKNSIKNYQSLDFPGGAVVENSPANAEHEFNPQSGKILHATEQLSLWDYQACALEPVCLNYWSLLG